MGNYKPNFADCKSNSIVFSGYTCWHSLSDSSFARKMKKLTKIPNNTQCSFSTKINGVSNQNHDSDKDKIVANSKVYEYERFNANASDAYTFVVELIRSVEFLSWLRLNDNDFIKKGKIDPREIVFEFMEQQPIISEAHVAMFNLKHDISVTRQSMGGAIAKMNPEAVKKLILELNRFLSVNFDLKTFKGFRLLASDGSKWQLATKYIQELNEKYGFDKVSEVPMLSSYSFYDLLNKSHLCIDINTYNYSEKTALLEGLDSVKYAVDDAPVILMADRNTASIKTLYSLHNEQDFNFVFRIRKNDYTEILKLFTRNTKDITVRLEFNSKRLYAMNKQWHKHNPDDEKDPLYDAMKEVGEIELRFIKYKAGGNTYYIVTNLSKELFSYAEICELYRLRWSAETSFSKLKDILNVNDFRSTKWNYIETQIYAGALSANLKETIVGEAQRAIDGKRVVIDEQKIKEISIELEIATEIIEQPVPITNMIFGCEREYQINFSLTNSLIKLRYSNLLSSSDKKERDKAINEIISIVVQFPVKIKPNRKFKIKRTIKKGSVPKSRKNRAKI